MKPKKKRPNRWKLFIEEYARLREGKKIKEPMTVGDYFKKLKKNNKI